MIGSNSGSKTRARTVLLNAPAKQIVERRMAQRTSPWAFSPVLDPSRPRYHDVSLWHRTKRKIDIQDVRLHGLRHTVASQAAVNGVPLSAILRLLGHSDVNITMRYVHVGDREIEAAAERVLQAIESRFGQKHGRRPIGSGSANLANSPSAVEGCESREGRVAVLSGWRSEWEEDP